MEEEIIGRVPGLQVRVMTLAGSEGSAWHWHNEARDIVFCLAGSISVELREPEQRRTLERGERLTIEAKRLHRVVNRLPTESQYLLVQPGTYDFCGA
jgi:quercetin dioxygenase-like cupin family protein